MSARVLITGASRGIGRAVAVLAAQQGCSLDLLGRDSPHFAAVLRELDGLGAQVRGHLCDLAQRSDVDRVLGQLTQERAPDLIIHNAGLVERARVAEQSDELWDRSFEVNVTAPMRITRALLPGMLQRKQGRILFVSSISAQLGSPAQSAYNASKAALVALMRCLAEELSASQLMTAALLPGSVDTDMLVGSGFSPRMQADEVARSLMYFGLDAPRAHNGAVIEMFGV